MREWRCPFCAERDEELEAARQAGITEGVTLVAQSRSDAHFKQGFAEGRLESLIFQIRLAIKYANDFDELNERADEILARFEKET